MFLKSAILTLYLLVNLVIPKISYAHPVDEIGDVNVYDQWQTLTVSPQKADLKINLTFYAFEKMKVWGSINTDSDQSLSNSEKKEWIKKGSEASWIVLNGNKFAFKPISAEIPDYDEFFSAKPVDIEIGFTSDVSVRPGDEVFYYYSGKDKSLSDIPLTISGAEGLNVLNIEIPDKDKAKFEIEAGNDTGTSKFESKSSDRLNNFLDKYVKTKTLSPGLFLIALGISFFIGMLHALTPGHGKAIVAGYLIGEKGTISHAVNLGAIITVTHTASVFLLGLCTLLLTEYVVPSVVINRMSLISGVLIVIFGLYLLFTRTGKLISRKNQHQNHKHSDLDEILEHDHDHIHHHHHQDSHSPTHSHENLSWKNLLPLGISGGIVPCIDALAILIVAISIGKTALGLVLLLSFSLGLATTLVSGGVLVVLAKQKATKSFSKLEKFEKYSSIASALFVTGLGLAIVFGKPL